MALLKGLEPKNRPPQRRGAGGFERRDGNAPSRGRPGQGPKRHAGGGGDYGRKAGFGDFGGDRRREASPWEKPAQDFSRPARPGNGGKVFVPKDFGKKRPYKPAR